MVNITTWSKHKVSRGETIYPADDISIRSPAGGATIPIRAGQTDRRTDISQHRLVPNIWRGHNNFSEIYQTKSIRLCTACMQRGRCGFTEFL